MSGSASRSPKRAGCRVVAYAAGRPPAKAANGIRQPVVGVLTVGTLRVWLTAAEAHKLLGDLTRGLGETAGQATPDAK